jgi:hypothetical protein
MKINWITSFCFRAETKLEQLRNYQLFVEEQFLSKQEEIITHFQEIKNTPNLDEVYLDVLESSFEEEFQLHQSLFPSKLRASVLVLIYSELEVLIKSLLGILKEENNDISPEKKDTKAQDRNTVFKNLVYQLKEKLDISIDNNLQKDFKAIRLLRNQIVHEDSIIKYNEENELIKFIKKTESLSLKEVITYKNRINPIPKDDCYIVFNSSKFNIELINSILRLFREIESKFNAPS